MNFQSVIYPKLRALSVRPHRQDGQDYILLRDPEQISDVSLLVPQPLAAMLAYCDGMHATEEMVAAFYRRTGIQLPIETAEEVIARLDEALMLDNDRFLAAQAQVVNEYRTAAYRPASLAGLSYPAEKEPLWQLLQDYLEAVEPSESLTVDWSRPVGLLSPHIDYPRGGAVYAQVWKRATQLAQEAELVILLGTDHYGSDPFTLTRQNYATPYGILPTATAIVDELAQVIGEDAAFAGELRHRGEHSLELVAVWLHHMRAGQPCDLVPILCGGFHRFLYEGTNPDQDPLVADVIATLQRLSQGRRTLIIASGDLAHVGPAFGGAPLNGQSRQVLRAADERLLAQMLQGDGAAFFEEIRQVQDVNNVCGVAPIYLTMRTLEGTRQEQATQGADEGLRGYQTGYATCPADERDTSVVTVGGVIFL